MKKRPTPQNTESSAPGKGASKFTARQRRALQALLRGPVMREDLDGIAGASNSPHVVSELRRMGLVIDCERVECTDRDGKPCRPGRYSLAATARNRARQLLGA